jgi:hypothetical protein
MVARKIEFDIDLVVISNYEINYFAKVSISHFLTRGFQISPSTIFFLTNDNQYLSIPKATKEALESFNGHGKARYSEC